MSFNLVNLTIADDGRILVTLNKKATGTHTQIWVTPTSAIPNLTIAEIEKLARQEAMREHAC